jgi:hypothetical protein
MNRVILDGDSNFKTLNENTSKYIKINVILEHASYPKNGPLYSILNHIQCIKPKLNSVALVRERTIPTERPPLVGEVAANFCGKRVSRGQRNGFPRSLISVL